MARLNPVVLPAKVLSDGTHKVRIALAHAGKTMYIVTDIIVESEKHLKNGHIVKGSDVLFKETRLRNILNRYQTNLDKITYANTLSCAEVLSILKNDKSAEDITIQQIFDRYISQHKGKKSTCISYKHTWNALKRYVDVEMVAKRFSISDVNDLDLKLRKNEFALSTINHYMTLLKTVLSFGIRNDLVSYEKDPWRNYKKPQMEVREAWIDTNQLKMFRNFNFRNKIQNSYRDLFMLSFYLGGINLIDITSLDFKKILKDNSVHYKRSKACKIDSKPKFIEYELPEEAREIILRLQKVDFFARLSKKGTNHISLLCNNSLKTMAKKLGIRTLIFYSARKTFSQIAMEAGVQTFLIDHLLGHSTKKYGSLRHYLYVPPKVATEALRKVLDYIK